MDFNQEFEQFLQILNRFGISLTAICIDTNRIYAIQMKFYILLNVTT